MILLLPTRKFEEILRHSSLRYFKDDCLCKGSNYFINLEFTIKAHASGNKFVKFDTGSTDYFILIDLISINGSPEL